jgi:PRTRC genetic system protein A
MRKEERMNKTVYNAGEKIPDHLDYAYILARDGYYLKKRTPLFEAIVKVDELPDLEEQKVSAKLLAPKIPYALIQDARKFFQAVYSKFQGEAMVFLLLEGDSWEIVPAKQEVSQANVSYENALHKEGKRPAGTIHSHCNMSASFSHTDDEDDKCFDGVHITLGKIFEEIPDIVASLAVNGHRFNADPEMIISGLPEANPGEHPWLEKVSAKEWSTDGWDASDSSKKQGELFPKKESFQERVKTAIETLNFIDKVRLIQWLREELEKAAEDDPVAGMYLMEALEEGGGIWA